MDLEGAFRQYQQPVYSYFLRTIGRVDPAEELTQETFFRACTAALRYRGDAPVKFWIFGIARRVLLESIRKGLFHPDLPLDGVEIPARTEDAEARLDLERAFSRLSGEDREVLVLVDLLGFEPSDAAEVLALEPGATRTRLHRARSRLRSQLEVIP